MQTVKLAPPTYFFKYHKNVMSTLILNSAIEEYAFSSLFYVYIKKCDEVGDATPGTSASPTWSNFKLHDTFSYPI